MLYHTLEYIVFVEIMTDIFSKAKRSEIMSRIKSKNTKLEIYTSKLLRKNKLKYKSQPKIFGNPDFLIEGKIVIFCDSTFWHGRNWRSLKKRLQKGNNPEYWVNHIQKNRIRDKKVTKELTQLGYIVLRFWDKDIFKKSEWCIEEIRKKLGLIC